MAHPHENHDLLQSAGTLSPISTHVSSTMEPRHLNSLESSLILSADVHNDSLRSFGSNLGLSRSNMSQSMRRSKDASLLEQVHQYEMKLTRQELELSNQQNLLSFEKKLSQSALPDGLDNVREKNKQIQILESKVMTLMEENEKLKNDDTLVQLRAAKKDNIKLKGEVDALKKSELEKDREYNQKLAELRKLVQKLENEVEIERENLRGEKDLKSALMQKMGNFQDLKRKFEELEDEKSQTVVKLDFSQEHQSLSHSHSVLLEKNRALQREFQSLKAKHEELLAQANITSTEISVYSETVAELQLQNKTLKEKITDLLASQSSSAQAPMVFDDDSNLQILELQRQLEIKEMRGAQLSNNLSQLEQEKVELLHEVASLKERNGAHQIEKDALKYKILQTEKFLAISQKQVNELTSLLESYRSEAARSGDENQAQTVERVQEALEKILQISKMTNNEYQIFKSAQSQAIVEQKVPLEQQQLGLLQKKIGELESENAKLVETVAQLEEKLQEAERQASQIVDHSKTKVLRLVGGPTSEAQLLREKCSELEKKIEILEAAPPATDANQNREAFVSEINKLTKDKEELEKNLTRLSEVFKKKSKLFREACCHLLGYQIDMNETTRGHLYTLTPTYAGSKEDKLVFKISTSGTISLLDSPFYSTIEPSVTEYLTQYRSYPAFLSSLVIKLFENTTMN